MVFYYFKNLKKGSCASGVAKNGGLGGGGLFGLWPIMSHDSTYAKSFIKPHWTK